MTIWNAFMLHVPTDTKTIPSLNFGAACIIKQTSQVNQTMRKFRFYKSFPHICWGDPN